MKRFGYRRVVAVILAAIVPVAGASHVSAQTELESELISGTCVGSPCPYGDPWTAQSVVWPESFTTSDVWVGYEYDRPLLVLAAEVEGYTFTHVSGGAFLSIYHVSDVNDSTETELCTVPQTETCVIPDLGTDYLWVEAAAGSVFAYSWTPDLEAPPTTTTTTTTVPETTTTTTEPETTTSGYTLTERELHRISQTLGVVTMLGVAALIFSVFVLARREA